MRLLLPLMLALTAAAPAAPVVAFDTDTDFSHYRSYSWVYHGPPGGMDPNLYRQIRVAVDRSLGAHGFVKSNDGDFAVAFTLGPRSNMHASDFGHYAPYYSGEEAAGHQMWINRELAERNSHEHTLAIDIYDNRSKHSVWHGLAPVEIVPQTRQAIVEHEVDDVLSLFPPKAVPRR
jgi:uncharacterized protein DUF4136